MSLSAIEKVFDSREAHQLNSTVNRDGNKPATSWVDRVLKSIESKKIGNQFQYATTVHPCIIDGKRVLIYEKGLRKKDPAGYENLKQFAEGNQFEIKEDERSASKSVNYERRKAKTMPMLLLASGIFMQGAAHADGLSYKNDPAVEVMPEVNVMGKKSKKERAFKIKNGKRFVTDPYGDVESILTVASETKRNGKLKRVSTRGITMPQDYVGGVINRYDYQFPEACGGGKFSYYEGEGFGALGYRNGKTVILDVMVGGGPFAAPQLWGPYDQVLGDKHNVAMKLMMGNGKQDGMGLLKASYAIGMTPVMAQEDYKRLGNTYVNAVQETANCLFNNDGSAEPVIRQANNEY